MNLPWRRGVEECHRANGADPPGHAGGNLPNDTQIMFEEEIQCVDRSSGSSFSGRVVGGLVCGVGKVVPGGG